MAQQQPLSNFSFVRDGKLAGSGLIGYRKDATDPIEPLKQDLQFLQEKGVKAIVTLTEDPLTTINTQTKDENEPLSQQKKKIIEEEYGFKYLHVPVKDKTVPTTDQLLTYCKFVDNINQQQGAVVTHCLAGKGRTGTMLASYMIYEGKPAAEAIQEIRSLRPNSVETPEQEKILSEFENLVKQQKS